MHISPQFSDYHKIRAELVKLLPTLSAMQKTRAFHMLFDLGHRSFRVVQTSILKRDTVPWYQDSEKEIYKSFQTHLINELKQISEDYEKAPIGCGVIKSPLISLKLKLELIDQTRNNPSDQKLWLVKPKCIIEMAMNEKSELITPEQAFALLASDRFIDGELKEITQKWAQSLSIDKKNDLMKKIEDLEDSQRFDGGKSKHKKKGAG